MNCLIDKALNKYQEKGGKLEVVRRYIMMKYRISIDVTSLKERIKQINMKYEYQN